MRKDYLFTGFGFDVLIFNAPVKAHFGEVCLDVNMNELEAMVVDKLLASEQKFSGPELKFLRKHVRLSTAQVADAIKLNESNLKYWEKEAQTGLNQVQEYAFRELIIDTILESKKKQLLKPINFAESTSHQLELKFA